MKQEWEVCTVPHLSVVPGQLPSACKEAGNVNQWFPSQSAHWHHMGNFKNILVPQRLWLHGLPCGQGFGT